MVGNNRLEIINLKEKSERIYVNDRGTFRTKLHEETNDPIATKNLTIQTFETNPDQFLSANFIRASAELKRIGSELQRQGAAIEELEKDTIHPGYYTSVVRGTKEKTDRLFTEFVTLIQSYIPSASVDAAENITLRDGQIITKLSPQYFELFCDGRWFEIVCKMLISNSMNGIKSLIDYDVWTLGHSGFWHELDLLLFMPDFSACFEVKSGGWGRNDILKLIAQRDDIGFDVGVFLSLTGPSEDYFPVSKAHPIRIFTLTEDGPVDFKDWLKYQVSRP